MEPVEYVFGRRCHAPRHIDDSVAAIGHECYRLVFLPALIFQDFVQPPLWLGVMALNQSEIAARAIRRKGFAHSDFKMGLAVIA